MPLALYRKYRPGSFAEVVGQEQVTEPLQQAIRNGREHHAYLFSGPRGCGKTTCARVLARSLNCAQGPTPEPCGTCESCVALAPNGPGSIDVIEIDAASHGGVDDARDLRERAFFAPVVSRYKVYVIDEAHMVSKDGFNALLKLVEEPPEHVKLVFCTTEPEKVIGTIRSRTHHYPFRLIAPKVLRELLGGMCEDEGIDVEPAVLPLVVRSGAGSARDALSVLDQLLAGAGDAGVSYKQAVGLLGYTDESLLDQVVDALAASDGAGVFETVEQVIAGGHDPRRFAADLLERLRDLVILAAVPEAEDKGLLDVPPDQLERMRGQADRSGAAALTRSADIVSDALTEMRGATSPRLLLELMCGRLLLPEAAGGEAALAARLDRLERRLAVASDARPAELSVPDGAIAQADTDNLQEPVANDERSAPEPVEPAEPEPPEPAPQPPKPSTGGIDVQEVRRMWPEVLEAVKQRRRFAWMVLDGKAQVAAVEGGVLRLSFAREGDAKGFSQNGCDVVLREALAGVLGVDWQVEASGGQPPPVAGAAPQAGARPEPPAAAPARTQDRAPAPDPDEPEEPDGADPADAMADDGLTGLPLLERELGAQVIQDDTGA
ncbi:MAG: DNA polymerase III subunit gamma and tau [Streptosporangiales bacterium]